MSKLNGSRISILAAGLVIAAVVGAMLSPLALAASASLSLASSRRTISIGETASVSVVLSTGGVSINAASATISFDRSKLEVTSISRSGSVFTLWAEEPTFSNSQGIVSFGGGLPTPGFSGSGATLIRISFRGKEAGPAAIRFSSGAVLANDGLGTNVLAGLSGLDLTVQEKAAAPPAQKPVTPPGRQPEITPPAGGVPAAPVIISRTHPDENVWYRNDKPGIIWELPTGTKGVSVSIDQNEKSDPGTSSEGVFNFYTSKEALAEGVWYAHVRISNSNGWGVAGHYRLAIDKSPPEITSAKIVFTSAGQAAVEFATSDSLSSTDRVSIRLEEKEVATQAGSPYSLPTLSSGEHKITLLAYDKAGNKSSADLYLFIVAAAQPAGTGTIMLIIIICVLFLILIAVFIIWYVHERHHRRAIMAELYRARRELKGLSQKLRAVETKLNKNDNKNNLRL